MTVSKIRRVSHPGVALRRRLKLAGMTATALSRKLNVPANRVTSILNGTRAITGDTALRLAHFFNTAPDYWSGLQMEYDLYLASKQSGLEIMALPTMIPNKVAVQDRAA
jgi:addiction module HigA family antidote